MKELIAAAAEATGWPASMVERSARARAQAEGTTPEAVLTAWAGGGEIDTSAAPAAAAEAPAPAPAAPAVAAPAAEEAAPAVEVEVVETAAVPEPPEEEPAAPAEPEPAGVPRWLAASFVILPAIAIFYALFFPNGPGCGVGAQLAIDPATGQAENCDGTPYGEAIVDFFSIGEELYAGRCAACHGPAGEGAGNFPALSGGEVVITFPTCDDHVLWIELGTLGWPDATYGATAKPVGGSGAQMPAFGGSLTPQELAAVTLYERVAFGGVGLADAEADCGLTLAAGEAAE